MKRLVLFLALSVPAFGQLWTGVLAPARATDWTSAGIASSGVLPSSAYAQCGATVAAGTSAATINGLIAACATNTYLKLGAGVFPPGIKWSRSNFALRGSGAHQTFLQGAGSTMCPGGFGYGSAIAVCTNDNSGIGGSGSFTWSSGYAQGATTLNFNNTTGINTDGTSLVFLDQCNDGFTTSGCTGSRVDTGNYFVCEGGSCTSEGSGTNAYRPNRSQIQVVVPTSKSGTSITIPSPGLHAPQWRTGQSPGAWKMDAIQSTGIEDLSIDATTSGSNGILFWGVYKPWVSGVRIIAPVTGGGDFAIRLTFTSHAQIQNNYVYLGVQRGADPYALHLQITSDSLIVNNICQQCVSPIVSNGPSSGDVFAYNYTIRNNPGTQGSWSFWNHSAGIAYQLWEGNVAGGFANDDIHGTHNMITRHRNYFTGKENSNTSQINPIFDAALVRYGNITGNVVGFSGGLQTVYQADFNDPSNMIYVVGWGNTIANDPIVGTSMFRWGNWDAVTNNVRFCTANASPIAACTASERGESAPVYPGLTSPSTTLPASYFYSAKPLWMAAAKPWPLIGPDVSTGNIANTGGHANTIPAQDCAATIGVPSDGSGSVRTFNAATCYTTAPGVPAVSLNPTSLVFGTFAIGVTSPGRLITLTNTGTATLNIASISASIEYAQTTTCGATLGAGLACTITVTFTPLGVGLRNGAITIVDNASGSPHTVALSGTGTGTGIQFFGNLTITGNALFTTQVNNVPGMSISPGSLAFGSLALGGIATLPITITSTGNSQLVFTSIMLADSVNYSQTNNCTVIVPTASCTINVTFSPQSIAALNTSLTIIANDSGSPHVVTITGTGIAAGGDLPLPTFTPTALSLPQAFVDPMAPFSQTVQATIYIGNTTCPTAPLRTNYKGVSVPATVCDFADANGAGLQSNLNDWCSFSFGGDQRWDVIVTKGTSFDFSASPWLWCDKYNGTPTQKYIVFHSDTPNPRGRQVCSHGVQDLLVPPLPDMGQRNHGCTGLLGLPAVSVPMPVTSAAYTSDSSYNDLANMWTITASGPVIQMGAASTLGDPFNDCGIPSGAGACPTDGVNHIVIQDARIMPAPSLTTTVIVAQVKAAEWTNAGGILIAHFLPAAPHDIGFDEDYFTADADDDGFGNNKITDALQMACATCWFNHNYADGIKRDGSEDHVINTANSPGPVLVSHNWMEGGAIAFWGGQAETPLVTGLLNSNTERRRNRMTYNPRWLPSPGGLQSLSKKISGGSCSGGNVLVLNIPNTGAKVITNLVVYLKGVTGVGTITNQWYTAASVTSTAASLTIPCTNGTVSAAGNVFGFATGINITSAAAMNGKTVKDPTSNNPVSKNRSESKSGVRTLADGEICENSGADGQDGSCYVISSRAYSGSSWGTGGENKEISDWVLTNSIVRNSNNSISIGSRSGSQIIGQFTGVTSIVCAASGNTAAITATGLNGGSGLLDPPNTQTATGTDIYLTDIGNGAISGTPLLANGFYATAYPTGGSYHNDAIVTVTGTAICPASDTTTAGTVYAPTGGNGVGVNTPGHRYVFQNLLIYNIGDHGAWNGGGSVSVAQVGSGLNNWAVNMTVTQVSPVTIVNAAVTAISVCPASQACPKVVQATVGDLAYVQCLSDPRFSSSLPNAKGARMLSVAGNQLSFTYTPQNGSPALTLSDTTTCGLQTPDSSADSGYYGFQSFPWPFYWNHITGVGVNSFWLSPGGQGSYIKTATYANSFQLQPGVADIAPANLLTTGGVHCNNSETYSPTDTGGITFCNDRTGLTFQRYVMSTRSIANFPNFLAGVICGSPPCTQDPVLNPGTNSTPVRVSTPGSSVTCGGVACDATHFIPDSIGFSGAMVTSNYPLTLPDFRNYSLDSSSPYKAGGILQGMDGKDVGVQMSILLNAQNRTLYVCGLPCGAGPFRDGPRYGFIVWNASTDPSHINYRIYRNGAVSPTAAVTNAYFSDYGLPSGVNSWVVKDWNGTIETSVSGLTTTVY